MLPLENPPSRSCFSFSLPFGNWLWQTEWAHSAKLALITFHLRWFGFNFRPQSSSLSLAWELIWSWDEFALPSHFDTLAPKQTIDQSNFSQNFSRAARKSVFDTFDIFGLDPQTNLWLLLFSDTSWTNPDPSFERTTPDYSEKGDLFNIYWYQI